MSLKQSNPYLRGLDPAALRAALRVSVVSSSAVEGIRAPLAEAASVSAPTSKAELIAHWRRRLAGPMKR